jgi:Thoeris protein ThsB, TIR-like domain
MSRKRAFISFDYDHDEDLRMLLAGQAKHPDSPFDFTDRSIKEPLSGDWKNKVRRRMANTDVLIVICGEYTNFAQGVATELSIAHEMRIPYFLLAGRADKVCSKPSSALSDDKMYRWTWDNLKALIAGNR